jgi:hypothetical protein
MRCIADGKAESAQSYATPAITPTPRIIDEMRDMHLHCHRGSRGHSGNGCLLDVDPISAKGWRGAKQPGKALELGEREQQISRDGNHD